MNTNVKKVLVSVAWPYVNGNIHVGHLAGYLLPADVFARFQRLTGNDVLMVSGSDCHGTPITVQADKEGLTPREVVDKYHAKDIELFNQYNLDYSLYTKTTTEVHKKVVQDMFVQLLQKGYIIKDSMKQYYSEEDKKFLPDRYVEGTCPYCKAENQRSDQCENCGRWLGEGELIDPISKETGAKVELKETEHYFLNFENNDIQDFLKQYLPTRRGIWKEWVYKEAKGWLDEGLKKRAITRDLDWGIELPIEKIGGVSEDLLLKSFDNKRIYVWFEAVIGYLSAPQEWASLEQGKDDVIFRKYPGQGSDWTDWWVKKNGIDAEQYYFLGQDNLVFHTLMWPAQIFGADQNYILPHNVVVNKFMNFNNAKFSKSRGNIINSSEIAAEFGTDAVRYFVFSNLPENKESNFTWDRFIDANNNELVANLGNFINRTLVFYAKNFESAQLSGQLDGEIEKAINESFAKYKERLSKCEFVEGLNEIMKLSGYANKYFNDSKIWEVGKTDKGRAEALMLNLLNLVEALRILIRPYLPEAFDRLSTMAGIETDKVEVGKNLLIFKAISGYQKLGQVVPLFKKMDKEALLRIKEPQEEKPEEKIDKKALYEAVKLVKILEINKHPNADKLSIVKITNGKEEFEIVTGADNMQVGNIVAYLGVGGVVPGWLINEGKKVVLEEKDLRGVVSKGMILAEDELGIGDDHSGIYIFEEKDEIIGKSIGEVLDLNLE